MGVDSLPKSVTRQRRDCDLNPGPSAPESSMLTTRLPSAACRDALVPAGEYDESISQAAVMRAVATASF